MSNETTASTGETTPEETSASDAGTTASDIIPIGTNFILQDWSITVTKVQILDSVSENQYMAFSPAEGSKYLLVTITAENKGKESQSFLPSFAMNDQITAKVLYGDGYEFTQTNLLGYSREFSDTGINPLSSKEGDIAFEIPNSVAESSEPLSLAFSMGNESATVALR